MFTVTTEWLEASKTSRGAYTQQQLLVLGIEWPPRKGWQKRVTGTEIRDAQSLQFERYGKVAKSPYQKCMEMIKKLNNTELQLVSDACSASIEFRNNKEG